jgi:hypothetical protein
MDIWYAIDWLVRVVKIVAIVIALIITAAFCAGLFGFFVLLFACWLSALLFPSLLL